MRSISACFESVLAIAVIVFVAIYIVYRDALRVPARYQAVYVTSILSEPDGRISTP
jgi:hypothetical protein